MAPLDDCFYPKLNKLGRRYRIAAVSDSDSDSDSAPVTVFHVRRSSTCCPKCGKRKRERERQQDLENKRSRTRSLNKCCSRKRRRSEERSPRRVSPQRRRCESVILECNIGKSGAKIQAKCGLKRKNSTARNDCHIDEETQCDLTTDAISSKVNRVFKPSCPPPRKRSRSRCSSTRCKRASAAHPVTHSRHNSGCGECSPSKARPPAPRKSHSKCRARSLPKPPSRQSGKAGTSNLQIPPPLQDYSEVGRRIWQTLFEATEPTYTAPRKPPQDPCADKRLEEQPPPRRSHRDTCRNARSLSRATDRTDRTIVLPTSEHRIPDPALQTGRFIKMKFGKRFHMVELPNQAESVCDDEVQVLFRQGKNIMWRKYKLFHRNHS